MYILDQFELECLISNLETAAGSDSESLNRARAVEAQAIAMMAFRLAKGYGEEPNLRRAQELYERAAKLGNVVAQHNLACMLLNGTAGVKDPVQAIFWFESAAELNDIDAQFNLALIYDRGIVVPQDLSRAFRFYKSAAENGSARAQFDLASMYRHGRGVERDLTSAEHWFAAAAAQGLHLAAQCLEELAQARSDSSIMI